MPNRTVPTSTGLLTRLAAIGGVLVVVAAACSNDKKSSSTTAAAPVTSVAATTPATTAPNATALTIGLLLPKPGLSTDAGTAQQRAVQLAVDDINGAGGLPTGDVKLVTNTPDTGKSAVDGLNELIAAGANVIVGPTGSDDAVALMPQLASSNIVACSASATVPALTEGETARRFFRTAIPDPYFTQQLNQQIAAKVPAGAPIAVISREDAYGAEVGLSLTDGLVALGYAAVPFTYGPNVVLFDDLAKSVVAAQPQLTIVVSIGEGVPLIGDLMTAGVQPATIVGLDGVLDPRLAEQVSPTDPSKSNGLNVVGTTGSKDLFARLIAADAKAPVVYAAQAYDCAVTLALSAVAAKGTDSDQIATAMVDVTQKGTTCSTFADCRDKLVAGEDIDYDGPSGAIRFDAHGDPASARFSRASVVGGQLQITASTDVDLTRDALIDAHETAVAGAIVTSGLQADLKVLGFYNGPIDGIYDDDVKAAVAAFQTSVGLPATGELDDATATAISGAITTGTSALATSTFQLQQMLTQLGFYTGPLDGNYSQATIAAVKSLQASLGVPQTGIIDVPTLAAAYSKGVADAAAAATTTTSTSSTTTTTIATTSTSSTPSSSSTTPAGTSTSTSTTTP